MIGRQPEAPVGSERPPLDAAAGEAIPPLPHLGAGKTENLRDDAEFEGAEAIVKESDDERPRLLWHDLPVLWR